MGLPRASLVLACASLACAPEARFDTIDVDVEPLASDVVRAVQAGGTVVVEGAAGVAVLGAPEAIAGTLLDGATFASAGTAGFLALSTGLHMLADTPSGLAEAPLGASFDAAPAIVEACGDALYLVSAGRLFRYVEAPLPELLELDVGFAGSASAPAVVTSATCGTRAGAPVLVVLAAVGSNPRSIVELDTARAPTATFRGDAVEAFAGARLAEKIWVHAAGTLLELEDGTDDVTGARRTIAAPVATFAADGLAAWLDVDGVLHRGDGTLREARGDVGAPAALFAVGDGSVLLVDVDGALARVR